MSTRPAPAVRDLLDLTGQVAVVTGASQGIGAAVAQRLGEAGATVVVHYRRNQQGADDVTARIERSGGTAVSLSAELTDPGDVSRLVGHAAAYGGPHILVNAAGHYPAAALTDLTAQQWEATMLANLTSVFLSTRAVIEPMRGTGGGSIVNIASLSGLVPSLGTSAYNSAKAGVLMLTRSSAQELGPLGIRVNAVSPGLVARPTLATEWPEGVARWRTRAPLGRIGEPEEVADACLFLASAAARWVSGHNLVVDGGMLSAEPY